jgi:succinoglycan biosynthesis transport protein ExoP
MMLQVNKPRLMTQLAGEVSAELSPAELYAWLLGFVRRQYLVIVLAPLLLFGLASIYVLQAAPKYTGHAVMLIDTHKAPGFEPQQSASADLPVDSATVDTQIEVLRSESIALSVIKKLRLDEDPEFTSPNPGLIRNLIGLPMRLLPSRAPAGAATSADFQKTRSALGTFQSSLAVWRVGLTYAIGIDFQSLDPDRSAEIANATADAYVAETLQAKYDNARRAAAWLQDRLKELREESSSAERAVVEFKAKNNIVDTGGKLMNEQQMSELNTALIERHTQTAEAKARLERIQQILGKDDVDPASSEAATVTDTLHNDVITKLRQQYLDLANKEGDWSVRYGPKHQAVLNLRIQMREIRKSIVDELRRIAETYKSDYDIARSREDSVRSSLADIVAKSQTMNEAQVTLHRLEANAQSARSLYDNFLQRYMESVQQQSFPVTDARLITQATHPFSKSSPRTAMVLSMASVLGLLIGLGAGLLRELSDRGFRTGAQVEERLRAECLALLPLIKREEQPTAPAAKEANAAAERGIARGRNLLWKAADSPFSRFTEAIRALKVAIDASKGAKASQVIGITSSLPNEGKSTIATALAQLIAMNGGRVMLVDCDLRNPSLSRKLAPSARAGLLHLLLDKVTLEEVVWTDPPSKLAFLPAVMQSRFAQSSEILASDAMRKAFERFRNSYDYVIVDLPPLAPVVDVRAMTHLVDSFIFTIEWGCTKIDVVEHALGAARSVYDNLLGVVLNKVDMERLGRYELYHTNYYSNNRYASYGYTD